MLPRIFLGFYTSSKLTNKHMQHKNINNMKLKKALENINTFEEMLSKIFDKLIKT
jgi:hypothetical protein